MNLFEEASKQALKLNYGLLDGSAPGYHPADSYLAETLEAGLFNSGISRRRSRAAMLSAKNLWDPRYETQAVQSINDASPELDSDMQALASQGIVSIADEYTAERYRNAQSEVVSRVVTGLIEPETPIVNNFFAVQQASLEAGARGLEEFVTLYETYSNWPEYYEIDINRGDIRSIEPNFAQTSERVNAFTKMYGVKIAYENFLHRALPNVHIAEVLAMMIVGWAKASAGQREYDAAHYLTRYMAPTKIMSNSQLASATPLGQYSGMAINGKQNGTLDPDFDVPRIYNYMETELGMRMDNLIAFIPKNAWGVMQGRKGYRRLLGVDGQPLWQRPMAERPAFTGFADERYGIRHKDVGHRSAGEAAAYLAGSGEGRAARVAAQMTAGPQPFLGTNVPSWHTVYSIPNSAFGPMKVVLNPWEQAPYKTYPATSPLRNDARTGRPRPVLVTDIHLFDGTRPFYFIETLPPTSWSVYNDEWRKTSMVMVEAYSLMHSARGQQCVTLESVVIDDNYTHDLTLEASTLEITDNPVGAGMEPVA